MMCLQGAAQDNDASSGSSSGGAASSGVIITVSVLAAVLATMAAVGVILSVRYVRKRRARTSGSSISSSRSFIGDDNFSLVSSRLSAASVASRDSSPRQLVNQLRGGSNDVLY